MKKILYFINVFTALMIALNALSIEAFADGEDVPANAESDFVIPYSYVLMEGSTGTLLYADNGNAQFKASHSAKLMTLLLVCEAIDRGELTKDSIVTVSKYANSMQGSQIWLDVGEKIPLAELVTAITVGNANDACVALAEAVGGTEEAFTDIMNRRADEMGMSGTFYADSTGISDDSRTSACDIAVLASALSRYDWLTPDFTTWMTTVRGGKAELVSQNRLIRSFTGITGMKAYYHRDCGNCLVASANRGDLTMICVILGDPDEFERFKTAKEKMTIGFSAYSIYVPKRKDIFLEPVDIRGGALQTVETEVRNLGSFIIRTGKDKDVEIKTEYDASITAPIEAGQRVGKVVYLLDNTELYAVDIVAKNSVKKMNVFYAFSKVLKSIFME